MFCDPCISRMKKNKYQKMSKMSQRIREYIRYLLKIEKNVKRYFPEPPVTPSDIC
jgi:hypothetical protein